MVIKSLLKQQKSGPSLLCSIVLDFNFIKLSCRKWAWIVARYLQEWRRNDRGRCAVEQFPPQQDFYFETLLSSLRKCFWRSESCCSNGMWKVAMSEELGKALQSVVERVNLAAARRPKVNTAWGRGGLLSHSFTVLSPLSASQKSYCGCSTRCVRLPDEQVVPVAALS